MSIEIFGRTSMIPCVKFIKYLSKYLDEHFNRYAPINTNQDELRLLTMHIT